MRVVRLLLVIVLIYGVQSCKKNISTNSNYYEEESTEAYYEEEDDEYYEEDTAAYPDATYCADVDYHNPNTGTYSTYTLNVEVEDNEVIEILFSSGWLDDSEFSSEELDEDGYCDITLYDGREFEIQITGPEC